MKTITMLLALFIANPSLASIGRAEQESPTVRQVRISVQGDTSRLTDFIQSLTREFTDRGMKLVMVQGAGESDYRIVICQETSVSGAAAAVIALDKNCNLVASVVRSGRWSGKGALNASAKEITKKIGILEGAK